MSPTADDDSELLGRLDSEGLRLADFSAKDRDFLRVLVENDGEADTPTLREEGALDREQVHWRYYSLEEDGLIEVDRVGEGHNGRDTNTARLTDRAERLVDAGLLEAITEPNASITEINQRVDQLRTDIQELEKSVDHIRRTVEENVERGSDPFTDKQLRLIRREIHDYGDFHEEAMIDIWSELIPAIIEVVGMEIDYNIDKLPLQESDRDDVWDVFKRDERGLRARVSELEDRLSQMDSEEPSDQTA